MLRKIVFILMVVIVTVQNNFSQEKRNAVLIDEFPKICSEDLMSRYDNFLSILNREPASIGHINFYGNAAVEGRNLKFIRYLTEHYPPTRGFDKTRIVLLRGENQSQMKIQFWLVPAGAVSPKPDKEFTENKIVHTSLFDKNWADFHKEDGVLDIYSNGFLQLGCEFSPNVGAFAQKLLSNADLSGFLIVYTEFGKGAKRGKQVANFALRDLIRNYRVPRNRLKAIYGGNRKEPEVELWLVPEGDLPPKPSPDKNQKN